MNNNYDKIAGVYDLLSKAVFHRSIVRSQVCLLEYVKKDAAILIIGGGTGWILEELAHVFSSGLRITYVDISEKMIALSEQRNYLQNEVTFVHQSVENFLPLQLYDIILTPFLFDNFSAERAHAIFVHLHEMLKTGGHWLFADFFYDERKSRLWQKLLLDTMYAFFRLICKVEADQLVNMEVLFSHYHYQQIFERYHYGRFIRSAAYRKI